MKNVLKKSGFTLVELLVVIAVIALLMAVLMPALNLAKEAAQRIKCANHLRSIGQAIMLYADKNDGELPMNFYQHITLRRNMSNPVASYFLGYYEGSVHEEDASERLKSMLARSSTGQERVQNLGYLMLTGLLVDSDEVLYCPSNKSEAFSYKAYGGKINWPIGFGTGTNPYSIRVSYSYLPQSKFKKHPALEDYPDAAYKVDQLDCNKSMVVDLLHSKTNFAHKAGSNAGCNMLFGDGSVVFKSSSKLRDHYARGGDDNLINKPEEWREMLKHLELE